MEFAFKFFALLFLLALGLISYAIIKDAQASMAKTGYYFPSDCK